MTLFSDKMLISHRCIRGLVPDLIKKSWTVSNLNGFISNFVEVLNFITIYNGRNTYYKLQILTESVKKSLFNYLKCVFLNPKRCGLFGGVLLREMKFVLSNCLSSEDLSISYES